MQANQAENKLALPQSVNVADLSAQLSPAMGVQWLATTDSTNQQLLAHGFNQSPYFLLGADEQTQGRGRQARPWLSESGSSLTFSIQMPLYENGKSSASLPLAIGVAVAEAIERWLGLVNDQSLSLKWPNDILKVDKTKGDNISSGQKIAGILIEAKRSLVCGIGINVALPTSIIDTLSSSKKLSPSDALQTVVPGALLHGHALEAGNTIERRTQLVALVSNAVVAARRDHERGGLALFSERWNQRNAFAGQEVAAIDNGAVIAQGLCVGLGAGGELLIKTPKSGTVAIVAGDVSVRRQVGRHVRRLSG